MCNEFAVAGWLSFLKIYEMQLNGQHMVVAETQHCGHGIFDKSIRIDYLRWGLMFSCPVLSCSVRLCGCLERKLPVVYLLCSLIACWPYWNVKKALSPSPPLDIYPLSFLSQDYSTSTSKMFNNVKFLASFLYESALIISSYEVGVISLCTCLCVKTC